MEIGRGARFRRGGRRGLPLGKERRQEGQDEEDGPSAHGRAQSRPP
jgi:hypothetical protein